VRCQKCYVRTSNGFECNGVSDSGCLSVRSDGRPPRCGLGDERIRLGLQPSPFTFPTAKATASVVSSGLLTRWHRTDR
jgi:hypothetical protein